MKFNDMPYKRVDFREVESGFKNLISEFEKADSKEKQFEVHKKFYKIVDGVESAMTIAYIHHDIDTTDEFYDKEREYYDQQGPVLNNLIIEYQKKVYESPYREYLEDQIGRPAFVNMELARKAFDEKIIPLMQKENELVSEYDKLIAGAKIVYDGKELNLSLLKPYMVSKDRRIREEAWGKFETFFHENGEKLDQIYDAMVKNRTEQARQLGYKNYVELGYYRMMRNCYGKEEVEEFRNQIKKDLVPFVEELNEKRRKRLGVDQLKGFDEKVYFKDGNPSPYGTPEEIMRSGQKMYEELSEETKEFIDFMIENELFDVLGRKTKKAGGYMTYIPDYRSPFIFANFNGTSGDIDVITHECGHAFQGYLSGKDPIKEHADITMETAEIHSMSMEFFTEKWMDLFFKDPEEYKKMHLESALAFIPYGCMVDEFQHIVYENPEYTPEQRKKVWSDLEKEYKPYLDFTGLDYFEKGGYWQQQTHIYNSPFYYIDYCIAQVCALQYKVMMDENYEKAWESYLKLCRLSASDFFINMIRESGLRNPFEKGCIKDLVNRLKEEIKYEEM